MRTDHTKPGTRLPRLGLLLAGLLAAAPASALVPLDDAALGAVYGQQGIVNVEVTPGNFHQAHTCLLGICSPSSGSIDNTDLTFVRLDVSAEIFLQAYLENMRLGYYDDRQLGYNGGDGWDIDLGGLDLGRGKDMHAPEGLYLELAYRNYGAGAANREFVGLRLGFPEMNGNIGLHDITTLSTFLHVTILGALPYTIEGHRQRDVIADVLTRGIGLNGTRDWWFSMQRQDIFWEYQNPALFRERPRQGELVDHTNLRGWWMQLSDNVSQHML